MGRQKNKRKINRGTKMSRALNIMCLPPTWRVTSKNTHCIYVPVFLTPRVERQTLDPKPPRRHSRQRERR